MANTYSSLFYHIIFSTKWRKRYIFPDIENKVWDYVGGIARHNGITPIRIGGIEDHLHTLLLSPPKYSVSQIAKILKADSSKWMKDDIRKRFFSWQDGYSAFSVSKRQVPKVKRYIENQRKHHEKMTFEEEYLELLRLHEVDIVDESYLYG